MGVLRRSCVVPDPFVSMIVLKAMGWAVVCVAVLVMVGVMLDD